VSSALHGARVMGEIESAWISPLHSTPPVTTVHRHMAGLSSDTPTPTTLTVHQQSRVLEIGFSDGTLYRIPFELMRVLSPSAEVQGHGPGQEVLQTGKRDVDLIELDPVGNYAVQPHFSDGHNTGIYSWDYLYFLGSQQERLWEEYLARLKEVGADRDIEMPTAMGGVCSHH
jgi:DUF971 family protein